MMRYAIVLIMYAAYLSLIYGYWWHSMKRRFGISGKTSKRKQKKMEREDFKKKAEANGWTIVECDYVITSRTIEAI